MSNKKVSEKGIADKIKVFCCFDEIVDIKKLNPNPLNPNKHPKEQVEKLAFIIKTNGWRSPITVSTRSGMIVKGHGRLEAAKLLKVKEVPVDYQDYESESQEYEDLLADNRIAELSETDNKILLELFHEYDNGANNIELTGYTDEDYKNLASALDEYMKKEEQAETEPKTKKTVICPHCGMEVLV